MKRILALTLAIILVLSCCPSVYTSAEEASTDSSTASGLDPHIKEIIESQLPQEERDALVSLDPSLADKTIIRLGSGKIYSYGLTPKDFFSKIGTFVHKPNDYALIYYVLTDKPYSVKLHNGKLLRLGEATHFIRDVVSLPAQMEINGKLSTVTGIYCFQMNAINRLEHIVCITTESEALFKYYVGYGVCKATYSEADFFKYGAEFRKYMTTMRKNVKGQPVGFRDMYFYDFINNYDQYKAEMNERLAQQRTYKIKQAVTTYGPIGLGVVLAAGVAAVGVVLYRKRRKAALPIEVVADPVDDP